MCLTEYDEAETMEMIRQETRLMYIQNLMDCTGWTTEQAMDALKIPLEQRSILYINLSKNS